MIRWRLLRSDNALTLTHAKIAEIEAKLKATEGELKKLVTEWGRLFGLSCTINKTSLLQKRVIETDSSN